MGFLESRPYIIGISIVIALITLLVSLFFTPPWTSPGSAVAIYSVLAFLTITITASAVNVRRTDSAPAHDFFVAGTGYASIVFSGAAIFYVFTNETAAIHVTTSGIFLNLVAFGTTGITMMLYSHYGRLIPSETARWNSSLVTRGIIAISLIIFGLSMIVSRLPAPSIVFLVLGYIAGTIAVGTYTYSTILAFQQKIPRTHDSRRLTISFLLLAFASTIHILILPNPTYYWLYSIALMGIAFMIAIIAIGNPFLTQIGVRSGLSYTMTVLLSAMVILPFIFTYLLEISYPFLELIDIGASVLIHLGGCIFAISIAYALYSKSKFNPTPYHSPIILLLVYWAVAEISLAYSSFQSYALLLNSLIPYILGGIVSIVLLLICTRMMLTPTKEIKTLSGYLYITAGIVYSIFISIAFILYIEFQPIAAVIPETTLNTGILLGVTFIALFILLSVIFLQIGINGGKFPFDSLATGSIAIWLVIMALKANFSAWMPGWWVADAILSACIFAYPLIIMKIYINEKTKTTDFKERAESYSKYLGENLLNHGTRASELLESIKSDSKMSKHSHDSVSRAKRDLEEVQSIATYLAKVISAESFSDDEIVPIDLIESVQSGLMRITDSDQELPVMLDGNKNLGECYVAANPLLSDAFYHLFVGAIRRIGVLHTIFIDISPKKIEPSSHWYCSVNLELTPAQNVEEHELFLRYTSGIHWKVFEFAYAQRIIALFGGFIQSGSTSMKDSGFSVQFEIILPIARAKNKNYT